MENPRMNSLNNLMFDPDHPWIEMTLKEDPEGSGLRCTRCGAHKPFDWHDNQLTLNTQVEGFAANHTICQFSAPELRTMPYRQTMTFAEAIEKALVTFSEEALKLGLPVP